VLIKGRLTMKRLKLQKLWLSKSFLINKSLNIFHSFSSHAGAFQYDTFISTKFHDNVMNAR
jgi:hypothetical protein